MPAPYVMFYQLPHSGQKMVSVVLDRADFMSIIDEFEQESGRIGTSVNETSSRPEQFEALRQAEHIPMIFRGTKTEKFFQRFNIPDDVQMMSAIVRGGGQRLMDMMFPHAQA